MITLSPIKITKFPQCSGFNIIDTTDYNQEPLFYTYSIDKFEGGLRIIQIIFPDGSSKLFCSSSNISNTSAQLLPLNTDITLANNTIANWDAYSFAQGSYTVNIVSIPYIPLIPNNVHLGYIIGDIALSYNGFQFSLYQCVHNLPLSNVFDTSQWVPVTLLQDFTLSSGPIPASYVNSTSFSMDCNSLNLKCIEANLECGFCKNCGGDICTNKNATNLIKASLIVTELELIRPGFNIVANSDLIVPFNNTNYVSDTYLNKFCAAVKSLDNLCNCNKQKPCSPCDDTSSSLPPVQINQLDILGAMNTLFDGYINRLYNQVIFGKSLSCNDKKSLSLFIIANVLQQENIPAEAPNYDCLNSVLGFNNVTANDILNDQNEIFINNNLIPINSLS